MKTGYGSQQRQKDDLHPLNLQGVHGLTFSG